ncbi:O-antigen ligase family protein [Rubritepida flocculans]|uniref:O-antigen ligase family protein n=1 Tax=Rubritepida flocculans TaxID=182403 RepID=UPI0003F7C16F|nr:O-antigen ligase family protein [Rubritepida flocculans]
MSGAAALAAPAAGGLRARLGLLFCGFGIYYYLDAQIPFLRQAEGVTAGSDPVNAAVQLLLLAVGLGYALREPRGMARTLREALPFLGLLALALLSVLWSQAPGATFRRCVGLATQFLFAFLLFRHLGFAAFQRLTLIVVLVAGGMSLATAALDPATGFDTGDYANAVRGVFLQKNNFGGALLAGAFALSYLVLRRGALAWRDAAAALLLLGLLALSRSATSAVLALLVMGLTLALLWLRRGGLAAGLALLGAGAAATLGLAFVAAFGEAGVFELLGRDETLTGRTDVWRAVDRAIAERPWLGHGFAAFWVAGARPMELIWLELGWPAPDSHHGLRDIALQLGLLGQGAVLLVAGATAVLALVRLGGPRRVLGLWTLMVLLAAAIRAQTEANLLRGDFLLLVWVMAWLALVSRQGEGAGGATQGPLG